MHTINISKIDQEEIVSILVELKKELHKELSAITNSVNPFEEENMDESDKRYEKGNETRMQYKKHYIDLIIQAAPESKNKYEAIWFIKQAEILLLSWNKRKTSLENIRTRIKKAVDRMNNTNTEIATRWEEIDYNLRYLAGRQTHEKKTIKDADKEKRNEIEKIYQEINRKKDEEELKELQEQGKLLVKEEESKKEEEILSLMESLVTKLWLTKEETATEEQKNNAITWVKEMDSYQKNWQTSVSRLSTQIATFQTIKEILINYKTNNLFDAKNKLRELLTKTWNEDEKIEEKIQTVQNILFPEN